MLVLRGYVELPPYAATDFDHGDVYRPTGQVFIAHTAEGTVDVIDGEQMTYITSIRGCREGSGVLCAQQEGLVFAAARGAGLVLLIDAASNETGRIVSVGPRPNGLAWDPGNKHLLVADVQENSALFVDVSGEAVGRVVATTQLPGRPRWCVFDVTRRRFLVNIREPARVAVLEAVTGHLLAEWPVSFAGPHGMDIDAEGGRVFVACDAGNVVALDLATGEELRSVPIAGSPDATWYNTRRGHLYVAIGNASGVSGVLELINTGTMTVEQQVPTEQGAGTTAYDEQR
jgi:DNA-binding beta-propeller fold protein YncE